MTAKQGQYLAFIYHYTKMNRCAPAESDLQRYLTLEKNGFITKIPGKGRSIQLLIPYSDLPRLE